MASRKMGGKDTERRRRGDWEIMYARKKKGGRGV